VVKVLLVVNKVATKVNKVVKAGKVVKVAPEDRENKGADKQVKVVTRAAVRVNNPPNYAYRAVGW
jgi:hypothetical protein